VCDIEDRNGELRMHFTQFYPLPGGQNRFYILRDEPSRLFWMASNLPADSQGSLPLWDNLRDKGYVGGPGNDRRTLILSYSIDGLNWFQSGCIARWKSPIRSFMYPVMAIDGDDLLIVARSNRDNPNQHDANLCTCHRIAGFRSLALNLYPGEDDLPHLDTQPPMG